MKLPIHRIYAAFLALILTALLVVTVLAFLANVTKSSEENAVRVPQGKLSTPAATVLALRLEPPKKVLDAAVYLNFTPLQSSLVDLKTGQPIVHCVKRSCSLVTAFRHRRIVVSVASAHLTNPFNQTESLPLDAAFRPAGSGDPSAIFLQLPVDAFPDLYPNDVYFLEIVVTLSSPGVGVKLRGGRVVPYSGSAVFAGGDLAESVDVASHGGCPQGRQCARNDLSVNITRKLPVVLFVEAVALVPFIFALLFLHLMFFHPRYRELGMETFLVPLIAAILAILPLRLVLVPSDIDALTRVDVALGIGLVANVSVALAKYITELLDRHGGLTAEE